MNARPSVNLSAMTVLFGVDDKKLFSRILNRFIGPENSKVVDAICAAIDVGNIRGCCRIAVPIDDLLLTH